MEQTLELEAKQKALDLRETKKIDKLVYVLRTFQEQDLDCVCGISGAKGFGKSVLGLQILVRYMRRFGCKCNSCKYTWVWKGRFKEYVQAGYHAEDNCPRCGDHVTIGMKINRIDEKVIWKYICYSPNDIFDKIKLIDHFSVIIADEAVNFAMGEDWMLAENKSIKKLFAQCRTKHLIILMNIPKFKWLQGKYRDDMINIWFRIMYRGMAIMMVPDLGENDDSWHIKDFEKLIGNYNYLSGKEEMLNKIKKLKIKHPCYFDHFFIPRLPEDFYQKYLRIRNSIVFRHDDKDIMLHNLHKLVLYNMRYRWDEFVKLTKGQKFPKAKILSEILFYDSAKQEPLLKPEHVRKYILEMRDHFEALAEAQKKENST